MIKKTQIGSSELMSSVDSDYFMLISTTSKKPGYRIIARMIAVAVAGASMAHTNPVFARIVPDKSNGNYTLDDFVVVFINIANWILGISGSLALLAFVWGGILFLVSSGNNQMVEKGKQAITGGAIGLAIVMLSWVIIQFVLVALGYKNIDDWYIV